MTTANGVPTVYTYNANSRTITDASFNQKTETFDAFGDLITVVEPDDNGAPNWQTAYIRNDIGQLKEIDQEGGVTDPTQWRRRYFTYDGLGRLYTQTTPEAGQYVYSYDANANITSITNQNSSGNSVGYTYDSLNRVITRAIGGGPTYTYTYDAQDSSGDLYGNGRMTSSSDGATVQARYRHDPLGRIIQENDCHPSDCTFTYQVSGTYDFQGNLRSITYPDSRTVFWVYDLLNRPTDEINTTFGSDEVDVPFMVGATYFPPGQLQDVIDGNGVEVTASADPDGHLKALAYNNGTALMSKTYGWSPNGLNLTGVIDSATGSSQTFTYDQLNRLKTSSDSGSTGTAGTPGLPAVSASSMTYAYDAWSNFKQDGTFTFDSGADQSNHLICLGCSYDAAGNQIEDATGNSFVYRADGHLVASNSSTYKLDGQDQRVAKAGSASEEYFYFGGNIAL